MPLIMAWNCCSFEVLDAQPSQPGGHEFRTAGLLLFRGRFRFHEFGLIYGRFL
jgi:hypothetical protein